MSGKAVPKKRVSKTKAEKPKITENKALAKENKTKLTQHCGPKPARNPKKINLDDTLKLPIDAAVPIKKEKRSPQPPKKNTTKVVKKATASNAKKVTEKKSVDKKSQKSAMESTKNAQNDTDDKSVTNVSSDAVKNDKRHRQMMKIKALTVKAILHLEEIMESSSDECVCGECDEDSSDACDCSNCCCDTSSSSSSTECDCSDCNDDDWSEYTLDSN